MTSAIALSAVFANVAMLLVLAVAVASPAVSQLARLLIASFAFACAWLMSAAFDAMRAPDWTMVMGGAMTVVSIVVVMATLHLWTRGVAGGDSQPEPRGDEGGGGQRRHWPDSPQRGGGGGEPSWWPEFERELALYVAERERENRQPAVIPAEPATHAIRLLRPV